MNVLFSKLTVHTGCCSVVASDPLNFRHFLDLLGLHQKLVSIEPRNKSLANFFLDKCATEFELICSDSIYFYDEVNRFGRRFHLPIRCPQGRKSCYYLAYLV